MLHMAKALKKKTPNNTHQISLPWLTHRKKKSENKINFRKREKHKPYDDSHLVVKQIKHHIPSTYNTTNLFCIPCTGFQQQEIQQQLQNKNKRTSHRGFGAVIIILFPVMMGLNLVVACCELKFKKLDLLH